LKHIKSLYYILYDYFFLYLTIIFLIYTCEIFKICEHNSKHIKSLYYILYDYFFLYLTIIFLIYTCEIFKICEHNSKHIKSLYYILYDYFFLYLTIIFLIYTCEIFKICEHNSKHIKSFYYILYIIWLFLSLFYYNILNIYVWNLENFGCHNYRRRRSKLWMNFTGGELEAGLRLKTLYLSF